MKSNRKAKTQSRPIRRKISTVLSVWRQIYANRKIILASMSLSLILLSWGIGYLGEVMGEGISRSKKVLAKAGFSIRDILVEGRDHISPQAILASLGVNQGDSIFDFQPTEAQKNLEGLSWVNSVMVQRRLPDTIYIRLVERQPVAIWQNNSKHFLIDAKGVVIDKFEPSEFYHLIVLTGKEANKKAYQFISVLSQYPKLNDRVKAATLVGGRRWDLILDNKVRVKLPEKNIEQALEKLTKMNEDHQLVAGHINTIDLRLSDRSFLYVHEPEHDKKNKGKVI